ncbi:response regulator [Ramlibacter sp.]|uniref:response regulator n=1 Tax=Ramlibacter sp. TaxID=1917967 RepID=UPI0035B3E746
MNASHPPEDLLARAVRDLRAAQQRALKAEDEVRALRGEVAAQARELLHLRESVDRESNSRLMVEEALDDTRERLSLAVQAARLALWEWDIGAGTVSVDARWAQITGEPAPAGGLAAQALAARVHPEDLPAARAALVAALKGEAPRFVAAWRLRTDSGWVWMESTGLVVARDMLDRATRMIGSHADITERKQVEAELARARDAAEAASRAKSEFLANMSHEVRTPLNGILGLTQLLAGAGLPGEQAEWVRLVDSSAQSLLALLNDVLDVSKIEAGKLLLEQIPFELRPWLDDLAAPHAVAARDKWLRFSVRHEGELPARVAGDPGRLRQVLTNLLSNAVKFTEVGEVELAVIARPLRDGHVTLRFEVADTGIGVPAEQQERLFEAFTQADSSMTRRFGGTGLGLAISDRLVRLMGGRLHLISLPGRGSLFAFEVALTVVAEAANPREATLAEAPVMACEGVRVLLVEDHAVNELLMRRLLAQLGCDVEVAHDGQQAVDAWARGHPDLVLMDVQMPVMSGLDATRRIREREHAQGLRPTPVVALTAMAMPGDRERCLAAGMDGYVSKPVTRQALVEAMAAALAGVASPHGSPAAAPAAKGPLVADAPAETGEPIHRERLQRQMAGDMGLLREVAEATREDLRVRMTALREAARQRDAAQAQANAHALKGALASLTADRAALLAKGLEAAVRRGEWPLFERALALFEKEAARVTAALEAMQQE